MSTLNQSMRGSKTYLNVISGKLAKKVSENEPNAVERVKKDGSKTHEVYYDSVSGELTSLTIKDSPFGQQVVICLDADVEIQFGLETRYATSILTKELIIGKTYTFAPYNFESEGKKQVGVSVKDQQGNKIPSDWTNVPALIEKKKAGKVVYDNTDRINYFIEKLSAKKEVENDIPF